MMSWLLVTKFVKEPILGFSLLIDSKLKVNYHIKYLRIILIKLQKINLMKLEKKLMSHPSKNKSKFFEYSH